MSPKGLSFTQPIRIGFVTMVSLVLRDVSHIDALRSGWRGAGEVGMVRLTDVPSRGLPYKTPYPRWCAEDPRAFMIGRYEDLVG